MKKNLTACLYAASLAALLFLVFQACGESTATKHCTSSKDCNAWQDCQEGSCVPIQCTRNNDCPPGTSCNKGFCGPAGDADTDM
ncbi:MAG: hypothetical protein GXP49_10030, partial [Deltaproteobacteria bacterium]|nr:hypothetical protein [Deltaproteobacteria bacterium]